MFFSAPLCIYQYHNTLKVKLSFQDIFQNMLTCLCDCQQIQRINRSHHSHRHHTAEHNGYYKLLATSIYTKIEEDDCGT